MLRAGSPSWAATGVSMDAKVELLRRVPLFAGLGGRDLEEVARLVDEVDVPAGHVLTTQGQSGAEFFVIVSGSARVDRDGVKVMTLRDGDFLGEISLIDGRPRSATVTAETPLQLLVLAHREFHSLLDRFPTIQRAVLNALAERVRRTEPETP
jgi:CRP/FNR family cyclic AMP-dependent transcriptional regulator